MSSSLDKSALRKTTVETLGLLVERYPNLSLGTILTDAASAAGRSMFDVAYLTDIELARGLNQLFVSYTQLEAAGIKT